MIYTGRQAIQPSMAMPGFPEHLGIPERHQILPAAHSLLMGSCPVPAISKYIIHPFVLGLHHGTDFADGCKSFYSLLDHWQLNSVTCLPLLHLHRPTQKSDQCNG